MSYQNFATQKLVPSVTFEGLLLSRHAGCVLSHLLRNGHSLFLNSRPFRIRRIESPSCSACNPLTQNTPHCHFCTVSLQTLCAARFLATTFQSMISSADLGEFPGFLGSMVSRHSPISQKRLDNNSHKVFQCFLGFETYIFYQYLIIELVDCCMLCKKHIEKTSYLTGRTQCKYVLLADWLFPWKGIGTLCVHFQKWDPVSGSQGPR